MPDYGHEAADKGLKKLEKDLKSLYLNAAVDMQEKARDFMRDFERKDEQMRALVAEGKWTEEQYNTWRRNQMMTEKRMQDMTDQLAKDLANTDKIAAGMINNTLPSAYAENYNFGTYEIETGTTVNTSFTLYDKKTVENLMKADPKIIPQARVNIPEDERWNRQKLTSAIAQGILQGESIPKIANRLQGVAAMDRNAAIRNARTYTTAAENKGRVDSIARANDMGIPADQEWLAVLDDRTRMEHRHLDGQTRPVGEPFETDGYRIMYPGDPDAEPEMIYNCRCTLVSKVRGRIYNDERNESKLNGMSYEEWKHAKDRQMEPPKEEPAHTIAEGKDLTGTWERRPDQFAFEIDDVLNAQGFDGLPQVVTPEEFDKAVKEANGGQGFIAQRTYSAPDQETLEAYREALYSGKWYVDCSTGGASFGRGMYTASTDGTKVTDQIQKEMDVYQNIASQRYGREMTNEEKMEIVSEKIKEMNLGESVEKDLATVIANQSYSIGSFEEALEAYNRIPDAENLIEKAKKEVIDLIDAKTEPVHRVETMTLDPRAKVTTYEKLMEENRQTQADVYQKYLDEALGKTSREELALFRYTTGTETKEDRQIVRDLKKDDREKTQEIIDKNKDKWKEINREANEKAKEIDRMDIGTFAALKGYDAYTANAEFSGADYTVILNRTKTIINGG